MRLRARIRELEKKVNPKEWHIVKVGAETKKVAKARYLKEHGMTDFGNSLVILLKDDWNWDNTGE